MCQCVHCLGTENTAVKKRSVALGDKYTGKSGIKHCSPFGEWRGGEGWSERTDHWNLTNCDVWEEDRERLNLIASNPRGPCLRCPASLSFLPTPQGFGGEELGG